MSPSGKERLSLKVFRVKLTRWQAFWLIFFCQLTRVTDSYESPSRCWEQNLEEQQALVTTELSFQTQELLFQTTEIWIGFIKSQIEKTPSTLVYSQCNISFVQLTLITSISWLCFLCNLVKAILISIPIRVFSVNKSIIATFQLKWTS